MTRKINNNNKLITIFSEKSENSKINRSCKVQFKKNSFIVYLNNKMVIDYNYKKNFKPGDDLEMLRTLYPLLFLYRFGFYSNIKRYQKEEEKEEEKKDK